MALTAERRASLMAYCRIDALGPGEEAQLEELYHAAVAYMAQAGVREPQADAGRLASYNLCVNALVLSDWDCRGVQAPGTAIADNPAFRRRLDQLKLTEPPVSDSDTAGE